MDEKKIEKDEPVKNSDDFEVAELDDRDLEDVSGGFLDWNCGCGNGSCDSSPSSDAT
jgi:natural product precursor